VKDHPPVRGRNRCHELVATLVALGLLSAWGCGDDDLPPRYTVSGTVTYRGKPVESGSITFTPNDMQTGRSAGGTITDGKYSLTTLTPDDGALPGQYKVSIYARRESLEGAGPKTKAMYEKARASPGVPIPIEARKQLRQEDLVPKKYFAAETSQLTADVGERTNEIHFDLKDD
jgi:hypothetical protein